MVYHEMPGWKRPTTNVKTFDDLPKQAQDYVEVRTISLLEGFVINYCCKFIESFVGVKVKSQFRRLIFNILIY